MTGLSAEFLPALLDPSRPVPDGLRDGQGRPAGRRFAVYRNNVAVSLTEALETGFPAIAKLLGDQNFRAIAGFFLRQHPPTSPLMMHYGAEFPDFLEGFEPLAHLPYLGDVARLELALRRSYHAADHRPLSAQSLGAIAPEDLPNTQLPIAPSALVLRSNWPVLGIWSFNMIADAPKPEARAEDALIVRPEFDPEPHLLPPGGASFVTALGTGACLADAAEAASTEAPDFDLPGLLSLLLGTGAITDGKDNQ